MRQPTPEELQRCATAACLATSDEPTDEDVNAARVAIANPSYARPGSWLAAVLAEWSRILASDEPDQRDAEIATLRAALDECVRGRSEALVENERLRGRLATVEAAHDGRLVAAIEALRANRDRDDIKDDTAKIGEVR